MAEVKQQLPALIEESRRDGEPVLLLDEKGVPVGWVAAITEDDIDDLLAQTPLFVAFLEKRRASARKGTIPWEQVKEELAAMGDS